VMIRVLGLVMMLGKGLFSRILLVLVRRLGIILLRCALNATSLFILLMLARWVP
jgi:hypothetical protein